jgi:hypothetical protein
MSLDYYSKYLKYKGKYISLRNQMRGGAVMPKKDFIERYNKFLTAEYKEAEELYRTTHDIKNAQEILKVSSIKGSDEQKGKHITNVREKQKLTASKVNAEVNKYVVPRIPIINESISDDDFKNSYFKKNIIHKINGEHSTENLTVTLNKNESLLFKYSAETEGTVNGEIVKNQ